MTNKNDSKLHAGKILFLVVLMVFSAASLCAWNCLPIFPDEIAIQFINGRFIQDHGLAQKLFYICPTNARQTPGFFVIPAWIYSWLCLHLSIVGIRILPFAATLAAIFFAIWYAVKGRNPDAAILVATALIGVAGSGLIIARPEYWQVFNLACCLWAFLHLDSASSRASTRFCLTILLLLSCLLSLYSHIQGLIFLPLTLYLLFHLVSPFVGRMRTILLLAVFFVLACVAIMNYHSFSCKEYPGIEQYLKEKILDAKQFSSFFSDGLVAKTDKFTQAFYYKDNYQIDYLPGISVKNMRVKNLLAILNQSIHHILMVNIILFISTALAALIFAARQYWTMYKQHRTSGSNATKSLPEAHAVILLAFPLIFLFFYDVAQNFYRSVFINLFISILLSMSLSRIRMGRLRILSTLYFLVCGVVVVASLAANVYWFAGKLYAGYEGPSASIHQDWDGINRDVLFLANDCGMDLSKGRIIVDDMTYESLKRYPLLYPVTYLNHSGSLASMTSAEIIKIVRPNYAITRCSELSSWGVTPHKNRNQLCGVNLLEDIPIKLDFDTLSPFTNENPLTFLACQSGWNPPEKSGTWTSLPTAQLRIPLVEDPDDDLQVTLSIGLLNLPGIKNRVRITAKGQVLFYENFAEGVGSKRIVFTYPRQLLENDHILCLTMESDIHVLGKLKPEIMDKRPLGIFLTAVQVDRSNKNIKWR